MQVQTTYTDNSSYLPASRCFAPGAGTVYGLCNRPCLYPQMDFQSPKLSSASPRLNNSFCFLRYALWNA